MQVRHLIHPLFRLHSSLIAVILDLESRNSRQHVWHIQAPTNHILLQPPMTYSCILTGLVGLPEDAAKPSSTMSFSDMNSPSTHRSCSWMLSVRFLQVWTNASWCNLEKKQVDPSRLLGIDYNDEDLLLNKKQCWLPMFRSSLSPPAFNHSFFTSSRPPSTVSRQSLTKCAGTKKLPSSLGAIKR